MSVLSIEIVKWPAQGWRPVDDGTGDEGGVTEGIFTGEWEGDLLMGTNDAVGGYYVLGFSCDPQEASRERATVPRERILLWHFNYHPDGGQLFSRWTTCLSWYRWRYRGTTSNRTRSSHCGATAAGDCISIPGSGTKVFSPCTTGRDSWTGRAGCMPG